MTWPRRPNLVERDSGARGRSAVEREVYHLSLVGAGADAAVGVEGVDDLLQLLWTQDHARTTYLTAIGAADVCDVGVVVGQLDGEGGCGRVDGCGQH